jgi:hypothetical protein
MFTRNFLSIVAAVFHGWIFQNTTAKILADGAVMMMPDNLIVFDGATCWRVVNDRPVGNSKRRFDEYSSKFSLSYETKV